LNISKKYVQIGNNTLAALNATISHNPYPTLPCPRQAPLYNGTHCLACPAGTYYLLTNDTCYSPLTVSNISYFYQTNNYFDIGNATLFSIATTINASLYPVNPCPSSAPLFNGTGCQACPSGAYYLLGPNNLTNETSYCQFAKNVTNMGALVKYFGNGSFSYANTSANIGNYSLYHKVNICPSAAPLALNNGSCVAYVPQFVTNLTAILNAGNYIEIANYTIVNLNAQVIASKYPVVYCPSSAPMFNGTNCVACTSGTYYLFLNSSCYTPQHSTNVTELVSKGQFIVVGNYTIANLTANISSNPYPTIPCPASAPLSTSQGCVLCPPGTYYILKNSTCYHPWVFSNVSAMNASGAVLNYNNVSLANLSAQIKAFPYPYL